jgi:hypothetical protein
MRRIHRDGYIRQPQHQLYVLGRLTLFDAVEFDQQPEILFDTPNRHRRAAKAGLALRAKAARIEELFIYDADDVSPRDAKTMQVLLSWRWDLPVRIGEPDYTPEQWAAKQTTNKVCARYGLFSPAPGRDDLAPAAAASGTVRGGLYTG